jgi:hypothetical protein
MNFSEHSRGKIVGMLVCCFGLCSGVFAQLYKGLFTVDGDEDSGRIGNFLLFLAIATSSVGTIGSLLCNVLPNGDLDPPLAEPRRANLGVPLLPEQGKLCLREAMSSALHFLYAPSLCATPPHLHSHPS